MITLLSLLISPAVAQNWSDIPFRMNGMPLAQPQQVPTKEMSLEDFFPKTDLPYLMATPIDMEGLTVNGLQPPFVPQLGQHLFIVVDNTKFSTMAELYKDNRLKNKSNFVTVDSIVHPYYAISNSIISSVVKEKVCPALITLLTAMLKMSAEDYKTTEDAEVKEDIQKNNAFLSVALRLLDPTLPVADLGPTSKIVDAELKNIANGKVGKSAIFDAKEDFAFYKPFGWYNYDLQLQQFYRCRQWLSRMNFPLSDTEALKSAVAPTDSRFRQSVLLFRALDRSVVNGVPGITIWEKLNHVFSLMGARENQKEHPLLPSEYKKVFRSTNQQLSNLLQGLSEPFYRTKLLLSIRRNQPVELGSTSILKMAEFKQSLNEKATFRLFPLVDEPEWPWMCALGHQFNDEKANSDATPFALLELYGRGSVLATNVLSELSWRLDSNLFNTLPTLIEATGRKRATSNSKDPEGTSDGRWVLLNHYFNSEIDGGQAVFKTELWMRHRLESAAAAWVDSHIASFNAPAIKDTSNAPIDSGSPDFPTDTKTNTTPTALAAAGATPVNKAAGTTTAATATDAQAQANNMFRPAVNHFLEPAPRFYRALRTNMQQQIDDLTVAGYMPAKYKQQATDFVDLCQHLENIADKEISNQYVSPADARFLGNIDEVFEKLSPPTGGSIYLNSDVGVDKKGQTAPAGGVNLCVGRPGLMFVMLRMGGRTTLSRGACYTYYELAGGPLKKEHLARKLDFSMIRAPLWTGEFDIVQPDRAAPTKPTQQPQKQPQESFRP